MTTSTTIQMPDFVVSEFDANINNGRVGTTLVSETDEVRVWQIHCEPGERLPVHRHQLNYFWTILAPGSARSHYNDGRIVELDYNTGDTQHHYFKAGEFFLHDLENIGNTTLLFTTVEFLDSPNPPLDIDPQFIKQS